MISINEILKRKKSKEKITMLTAYDYYTAKLLQQAGIDIILVGDSLGMVFQGEKDTLGVTVDDIIYHCRAVRKGADNTFIIADLPFMSYHIGTEQAKLNSSRLIIEGRANAVKLEGGSDSRLDAIKAITDCEIPVVGHLGLTPQSINKLGGYRIQGRSKDSAKQIKEQAKRIESAGAFMLVLEAVPELLAKEVSEELIIPVIGIGAGRNVDGQVLVINDVLGIADQRPKFSKVFHDTSAEISRAVSSYIEQVKKGNFPHRDNTYQPIDDTE